MREVAVAIHVHHGRRAARIVVHNVVLHRSADLVEQRPGAFGAGHRVRTEDLGRAAHRGGVKLRSVAQDIAQCDRVGWQV